MRYRPNMYSKTPSDTMKVGPSKAAQLARVARSTIYKDIEEGKLSAEQDGKGHRVIDVSELERVYGELSAPNNGETSDNVRGGQIRTDEKDKSDSPLQREVDFLRERLAEKEYSKRKDSRVWNGILCRRGLGQVLFLCVHGAS